MQRYLSLLRRAVESCGRNFVPDIGHLDVHGEQTPSLSLAFIFQVCVITCVLILMASALDLLAISAQLMLVMVNSPAR